MSAIMNSRGSSSMEISEFYTHTLGKVNLTIMLFFFYFYFYALFSHSYKNFDLKYSNEIIAPCIKKFLLSLECVLSAGKQWSTII